MVDLNNSLDALEYIVKEHKISNSIQEESTHNLLDQESIIEDYDESTPYIPNIQTTLELEEQSKIYRLGLTKEDHAKVLLLSSLIAKRYNRHIGKSLPSEKLNNAFAKSKFLNNSLYYKLGFVIFALIIWQFKISLISLLLVLVLIFVYLLALYNLISTEKYIFKYISAVKKSMGNELLEKNVNILELIYEIVRTKNPKINKSIKIKLKENYRSYIKEYKKNNKNIKVKNYVSYQDLLNLYEKDLYKKSVNSEDFIFRIIIEDIYNYINLLEKQKKA